MSNPFEKVRAFVERHSMLEGARGIVVAVSGGPDSVVLIDMLVRLRDSLAGDGDADRLNLHVAHLDHKLRGRESAEDAEFVERFATRLGLPVTIDSADVRAESEKSGRGIEEIARELRYKFLLAVALEKDCDRIATGHTMSDQAETFLMRLARGAGLRGLAAMRPVTKAHAFGRDEGGGMKDEQDQSIHFHPQSPGSLHPSSFILHPLLVRPLLCITREEVEQYCRERGLEFRNDSTNLSRDYTRNRVRHEVLPALVEVNPRAVENIARATEIIAEDEDALDKVVGLLLDQARVGSATGMSKMNVSSEVVAYSVPAILAQPTGLRRRMIIEAIRRARAEDQSCTAAPQISSAHVAFVEKLLEEQARGNRAQLPGGLEAWREFNALVFKSPGKRQPEEAGYEYEISADCCLVEAGGFNINLERKIAGDLRDEVIADTRREKESSGRDWMIVALDDAALPEKLVVRPRRAGEQARVVGHQKTIKLKNLMIGHKIPTSRRATWPIVVTPDDRYVWSPGLPPAVEFAARDKAKSLARLRASAV